MLGLAYSILHDRAREDDRMLSMLGKDQTCLETLDNALGFDFIELDEEADSVRPTATIHEMKAFVDLVNEKLGKGG